MGDSSAEKEVESVAPFAGVVKQLATAVTSMQDRLVTQLQGTEHMVDGFNAMMERNMTSLVHLGSKVGYIVRDSTHGQSNCHQVVLALEIRSDLPFPIADARARLRFHKVNTETGKVDDKPSSMVRVVDPRGPHEEDALRAAKIPRIHGPDSKTQVSLPSADFISRDGAKITIDSCCARKYIITILTPCSHAYNCVLTVEFKSPGTGALLRISHTFGVYLFHQLAVQKCEPNSLLNKVLCCVGSETGPVDPEILRRLLCINAFEGLCKPGKQDGTWHYHIAHHEIYFRLEENGQGKTVVRFSFEDSKDKQKNALNDRLGKHLCMEIEKLCGIKKSPVSEMELGRGTVKFLS